jgi:hypothetical protein
VSRAHPNLIFSRRPAGEQLGQPRIGKHRGFERGDVRVFFQRHLQVAGRFEVTVAAGEQKKGVYIAV